MRTFPLIRIRFRSLPYVSFCTRSLAIAAPHVYGLMIILSGTSLRGPASTFGTPKSLNGAGGNVRPGTNSCENWLFGEA